MGTTRLLTGNRGEEIVACQLVKYGFVVIARNLHTRYGELDIVAQRNGMTHVIEVKARSSREFGFEETVTPAKLRKIILSVHDAHAKGALPHGSWCIDVAFVWLGDPAVARITWVWNVGVE